MKLELYHGDCLEVLERIPTKGVKCIFADPPDNINLGYGAYKDKMPDDEYEALLNKWLRKFIDCADIVWFSFNARWTSEVGAICNRLKKEEGLEFKPAVQVFTFGQHNKHDLGNNHRPLWRLRWPDATLYPDQIKVPSWRQRNGDKRAAPGGRVPGDVFDMQYPVSSYVDDSRLDRLMSQPWISAIPEGALDSFVGFLEEMYPGDVFDFPRVTGNSKQRCDWHPTQLAEDLVERCLRLSTKEGDTVIDPFGGTGTTMRVCRKIGRDCILTEFDANYCEKIAEINGLKKLAQGHWMCKAKQAA